MMMIGAFSRRDYVRSESERCGLARALPSVCVCDAFIYALRKKSASNKGRWSQESEVWLGGDLWMTWGEEKNETDKVSLMQYMCC